MQMRERATQFYLERKRAESQQADVHAPGQLTTEQEAPETTDDSAETPSEQYPSSFHAIVELIATGQEEKIPGIRDIPLQINTEPPSQSQMERPKKPWET